MPAKFLSTIPAEVSSLTSCQLHSRDFSINSGRPKFPWFDPIADGAGAGAGGRVVVNSSFPLSSPSFFLMAGVAAEAVVASAAAAGFRCGEMTPLSAAWNI